ncbi:MAG: alginate export family protein [Sinobacteraceae bacterium]|nr:alginate export family protein [Nevskiaceae bacterium]MCP5359488.1 alginate export family protein [Nevskiaceae bacterium]MCP5466831.1 alginate export family protein [Nevskiaceae bacterium]MCP5470920.1 alginate export family protein [Nevskiaceae bacterium]
MCLRSIFLYISIAALAGGAMAAPGGDGSATTAAASHPYGEFELQWRARLETVDDAALSRDATATTLRTRLTWTSPVQRGWQAVIEVDDLRALDRDAYFSTVDGPANRPVVADPVGTGLNRAVLELKRPGYDLALGRQRLLLDDQRFVGNVGWRQNEQTYDGVTLRLRPLSKTELTLGWIANVERIYGPDTGTQAAHWHGDTLLLNGKRDLGRFGTLSVFWYALDFEDSPDTSNVTTGALWRGKAPLGGGWSLPWNLSYARQHDYGRNPRDYSAPYRLLELGLARGPITLRFGQELLGGDATRAGHRFQTPLATLHAFQGWADKFAATPPQGIDDRYATLEADWHGIKTVLAWHDYAAEALDRDYGTEWNIAVSRRFAARYELLGKYADYSSRSFAADTRKAWLMFTATF